MVDSPFTRDRFEYEQEHLYFLQDDVFRELERTKPVYVIGSRGTGKTTLLKALDWRERLRNQSLQSQLGDDPLRGFVGVYLKLPDIQLGLIDRWSAAEPEDNRAAIISLYLDLLVLEQILNAVSDLSATQQLAVPPAAEIAFAELLRSKYPRSFVGYDAEYPPTFKGVANRLRSIRLQLEVSARLRDPIQDALRDLDLIGQVGELGRNVTTLLYDVPGAGCHFKVSMDEGECLTEFQQLVVNSVVRLSTFPLFHVISFVSLPSQHASTLLPNLTLQSADRILLPLDRLSAHQFKTLSEGVASVRVQHQLGTADGFDIDTVLGPLDINRILAAILRDSVDPHARALLDAAVAAARSDGESDDPPPIYQTYLQQQMEAHEGDPIGGARWERRRQESARIRKRMVAAYLSICRQFRATPRYESAEMVLGMSDLCIRDLLNQLHHLFIESATPLDRFIATRVRSADQNRALRRASEEKRRSIPESGIGSPRETGNLIRGLAELTARIQSESATGRHLRSSEMGIFALDLNSPALPRYRALPRLIEEAAEAGFLRIEDSDPGVLKFRVHTSLAACFGFSYRGAYYECSITAHELESLRSSKSDAEVDEAVSRVSTRVCGGEDAELPLFRVGSDIDES